MKEKGLKKLKHGKMKITQQIVIREFSLFFVPLIARARASANPFFQLIIRML